MCLILETKEELIFRNLDDISDTKLFGYKTFAFINNKLTGYIYTNTIYDMAEDSLGIYLTSKNYNQVVRPHFNYTVISPLKTPGRHEGALNGVSCQRLGMHFNAEYAGKNITLNTMQDYAMSGIPLVNPKFLVFTHVYNMQMIGTEGEVITTEIIIPSPKVFNLLIDQLNTTIMDTNSLKNEYLIKYNKIKDKYVFNN